MLRRIVGAFALAAVVTSGAQAQFAPISTSFTLTADLGTDIFGHSGGTFGSYNGFRGNLNFPTATPTFQTWCVDETHFSVAPSTYNVWVTSFNSTDYSHVRTPSAVIKGYEEAAYLTQFMAGTADDAVTTPAYNNAQVQYAIWELMGFSFNPAEEQFYNATAVGAYKLAATNALTANPNVINPNNWVIITDTSAQGIEQEFIAQIAFPKETGVPEPGTMAMLATGLVGMAGAGFRRRRNK